MQLQLLKRHVTFGSPVVVLVYPDTIGNITVPSVEEGEAERWRWRANAVLSKQL